MRVLRKPVGAASMAYLLIVAVVAVISPLLFPTAATQQSGNLLEANLPPGPGHVLGTDLVGRDVLQRLLVGTAPTMLGVVEAIVVVAVLGVSMGLFAGYFRGWFDRVVLWLADLVFSVPAIAIIIVVLSIFPTSLLAAMVTFGLLAAPSLARVVRSATLSSRQELYVDGARVAGLSDLAIVSRHVLPRIAGVIIVQLSVLAGFALATQVGLAFLKLIVANPAPSWGGMISDGVTAISANPWLIWPPGIAVALTIIALGLLGDVVRDATVEPWMDGAAQRASRRTRKRRISLRVVSPLQGDVLRVEDLGVSATKPGGESVRIVDAVSFRIAPGECVGLVGESGCGKSITASAILGVLPGGAYVDGGGIGYEGEEGSWDRIVGGIRGSGIGFISQEPLVSLDPAYTVGSQLIEAVRKHSNCSREEARRRVQHLLTDVELADHEGVMRKYPHELSGGMAQRVSIARALAGEPRLLVADEPTTALDVTVQKEILSLLTRLKRERGMSILLITHDWGVVAQTCDRAIVMYAGQIVESAEIVEIFQDPRHPYTRGLLASDPHRAIPGDVLPAIAGVVPTPGQWPAGCHFADRCPIASSACRREPVELRLTGRRVDGIDHDARCIKTEEEITV